MTDKLAWGIIGTGSIAKAFAQGVARSKTGKVVAVGSRAQRTADAFGEQFKISRRYGSYDALLADRAVQAVYISTPHPMHAEWAIKAADAGKHILCEKPIGINHAEAMAIVEAAQRNDVFLMEAYMYRCHPQTRKVVELLREGVIGKVRVIQAAFSFDAGNNLQGRLLNQALGGGGILDVGGYCISLSRLVAGVANGRDIAEPLELHAVGHLGGESRVDEYTVAVLKFPGDVLAQVSTGVRVGQENVVRIFGTEGNLFIPSPWIVLREGGGTDLVVQRYGEPEPRKIRIETDEWLYGIEADTVAAHLDARQAAPPAMNWEDTLGNARALDRWRAAIGLVYDFEQPAGQTQPLDRRPLSRLKNHTMRYGEIAGIAKPVSRLIMGCDNQTAYPHACVMYDDFFQRGGNCFDTAWIYGRGACEKPLGHWIRTRGVREDIVLIDKGAHTPCCNPADLTAQLLESLEWLQTDYLDLYLMHRDNLDIPVGEFIDVLNEHTRAGRMRSFGVSNWTLARVEQANEYARRKGLVGMAAISNNFSLARMIDAPWGGCIASSDPESRAWFSQTRIPLLSWSSQARGFFTDRAHPDKRSDAELVRCWYSDDNFQRQARARELAAKRGVLPINIALAYVLCQPFPAFALIGPRQLSETRSSMPALDIELSPDELRWLNLED